MLNSYELSAYSIELAKKKKVNIIQELIFKMYEVFVG